VAIVVRHQTKGKRGFVQDEVQGNLINSSVPVYAERERRERERERERERRYFFFRTVQPLMEECSRTHLYKSSRCYFDMGFPRDLVLKKNGKKGGRSKK